MGLPQLLFLILFTLASTWDSTHRLSNTLQRGYFECPHSSAPVFLQNHTSFQPTASLPWPAGVIFIPVSFAAAAHSSTVFQYFLKETHRVQARRQHHEITSTL